MSCPTGSPTRLTGSVYDPSGQVALYNAIVYVPNGPVAPLPTGVTCDQCGSLVTGSPVAITLTGPDGKFQLDNVPVGPNIPLVIQVGKWRRQVLVPFNVQSCTTQPITDVGLLHLPKNQSEGDIPQMAISTGSADPFECLLRKMGISYSEMTNPAGSGRIHFYRDNGLRNDAGFLADSNLLNDGGTLARYDVVLLPCRGGERFTANPGAPFPAYTQNLVNYTSAGGRLFTTHYGYVWMAFGQPIFQSTAQWRPDEPQDFNPPNIFRVNVNQGFPKGDAFAYWLLDAGASISTLAPPALGSPIFSQLDVEATRHDVRGTDGGTTTWLSAPNPNDSNNLSVQHLTFNTPYNPPPLPDGDAGTQCGRVVFSDFHVTAGALADAGSLNGVFPANCKAGPMTPQEKALVFMLFDVSSCVQSDNTAPTVCTGLGDSCRQTSECCQGLKCADANQDPCFEGACTCQVIIG